MKPDDATACAEPRVEIEVLIRQQPLIEPSNGQQRASPIATGGHGFDRSSRTTYSMAGSAHPERSTEGRRDGSSPRAVPRAFQRSANTDHLLVAHEHTREFLKIGRRVIDVRVHPGYQVTSGDVEGGVEGGGD